ncbi:epi-1 [Symbiodinium natans]|uniref:Epi-1 protein n=1 Tax=Symbiodinium natans TaxID=878477 RepID=A0A812P847_9DINO|nr:epi-1 [Symbiodinium natans]
MKQRRPVFKPLSTLLGKWRAERRRSLVQDLVEKAEITSAMIEHVARQQCRAASGSVASAAAISTAGDDLSEAQKAAEQTEVAFSCQAAELGQLHFLAFPDLNWEPGPAFSHEVKEAIGLKLGMLKQFESDQGRLKATDSLGTFREKLRVANQPPDRKLLPFLAAQDTFKAQVEAKKLSDEMEAKLMPAEVEVERAETIAEPLLHFAEAALAAGQAAAEATATPKAKAKAKEKEPSKPAKSKSQKQELPSAEVVALATKHASEAAVNIQAVQKLLDQKRSNQQVLFSAPMKKVLEKVEARIRTAQKKLDRIKIAQKELRERETSTALVSDVAEKMETVSKAIKEAKSAVDAAQGEEEEALKAASKAAALAKVAISMKLLEVKRFTAEAGIQAQRSLQEHQQTLHGQGSLSEIEALKKTAAEQKENLGPWFASRKVEEAEALAEKAEQTSAPIFDDEKLASMSSMARALDIRQAGDVNQRAYKDTIDAVNQAQRMITMLQIEAKNKENAAELAAEYAKLQARLRQAEASVSHCASLPEPVQKQLILKGFIDEVESKVKAVEGKANTAEQLAKEAEENPFPEQARLAAFQFILSNLF